MLLNIFFTRIVGVKLLFNGIESSLDHIDELDSKDFSDLHEEIKEMLGDLNKNNFKKAGKFIVNLSREEE